MLAFGKSYFRVGDLWLDTRVTDPCKSGVFPRRSGLLRPYSFGYNSRDYDYLARNELAEGRDLLRQDRNGLYFCEVQPYASGLGHRWEKISEQWQARDYTEACKQLGLGKAGQRARELLLSSLSHDQLKQVERHNYFDIFIEKPVELPSGVLFDVVQFRIHRDYPNGNIHIVSDDNHQFWFTLCYHPRQPYPLDDICYTQKVMIENDLDTLLYKSNVTEYHPDGGTFPRSFNGRLWDDPEPERLSIPFSKDPAIRRESLSRDRQVILKYLVGELAKEFDREHPELPQELKAFIEDAVRDGESDSFIREARDELVRT